jgi:hypothetical protein
LACSKINDLTLIALQKREKRQKKVAVSYVFSLSSRFPAPSTTVNTIHPVVHHNAKSN